jgi:hypothetical protein
LAAANFDYELSRTKDVPGFFMVKIFASNKFRPIRTKEIFVKNFVENEAKIYRELFPFLQQQRQAKIVDISDFSPKKINSEKETVIILGNEIDGYLNFKYEEGDIFNQFQNFAEKNLSPVLLNNLKVNFGGNIFDVQTKQDKITFNSPAIFIGKFKDDIRTRMEISAKRNNQKIELITPLDLSDAKYIENSTTQYLPELWDQLANPVSKNPAKKDKNQIIKSGYLSFIKFIPYLFTLFVLFILFFIIRYFINKKQEEEDFEYQEEIPIFHSEIPEEEYRKHETNLDENFQSDPPFEVVWKNEI